MINLVEPHCPMDYLIRALTPADEPLLWDMLYQALQTSEGAPSRDILKQPEYARYVEEWGREGDTGFVVSVKNSAQVLVAVWNPIPPGTTPNEPTPELA